ncbi:MAG: endonuclease/exonuclease/phosphatase family protein [Kofleriaceae bacterium]
MLVRTLAVLIAVAIAACANRTAPIDRAIEATFPAQPATAELARQLRVVTYNVHREPGSKIIHAIESSPELRAADLILLQEVHRDERSLVTCSGACALGKRLGYHTIYAPGHNQDYGSDGVAILSRAPITSAQVIELPYFDVRFNSGRRVAVAATLVVDGTPITVYAVHLDNRLTVADRRTQMQPVLEHARRQPTPVIIAGDFNTSPFTWIGGVFPILTTTQDNHLEQLVRSYGFATPVVASGSTHRYLPMKLDAIYTRGFDVTSFATSDAARVSDHRALWARLQYRHDDELPASSGP